MSDSEGDSNSKSVSNEEKKQEEIQVSDKTKKRTWTPARIAAWQKCLEGRQEYLKTKKEILEKESEEKILKQKIKEKDNKRCKDILLKKRNLKKEKLEGRKYKEI